AEDAGTDKDLDLYVEDINGRLIGKSALTQISANRPTGDGETRNPRERVELVDLAAVPAGQEYRIRLRVKGGAFGPQDRVRLLITTSKIGPIPDQDSGNPVPVVELLETTNTGEIYPPADHPGVLTVGDTSRVSAAGPTADGRAKPDVVLEHSMARFSNG